jgi:imidazolonepropionase-like amidohydrolase
MVLIGSNYCYRWCFIRAKKGTNAQFSQEEMDAIVSTAKIMVLQVAAHAHGDDGMQRN